MANNNNPYRLHELEGIDIDSWVQAMGNMADKYGHMIPGYKDDKEACPAEYETEFENFASEKGLRFSRSGEIVSAN